MPGVKNETVIVPAVLADSIAVLPKGVAIDGVEFDRVEDFDPLGAFRFVHVLFAVRLTPHEKKETYKDADYGY